MLSTTEPALNPGVSMRSNDGSLREGGELPESRNNPTRKAYAQRIASASASTIQSPGFDASMSRMNTGKRSRFFNAYLSFYVFIFLYFYIFISFIF